MSAAYRNFVVILAGVALGALSAPEDARIAPLRHQEALLPDSGVHPLLEGQLDIDDGVLAQEVLPQRLHIAVAAHLRQEWRVPAREASTIVGAAFREADRRNLDPFLVLAVIARESSFRHRPEAAEDPCRPFGLMQVAGCVHAEKFPDRRHRQTTMTENIAIGVHILHEYLTIENGNLMRALQRYNGALADLTRRYASEVLILRAQLRGAVARQA